MNQTSLKPVSVSQLNLYLKNLVQSDPHLKTVCVEGEISNLTLHSSGHIYMTLKDDSSAIRAVMFRGYRASLKFIPKNGMKILVIGDVNVYDKTGTIQIYVTKMMQAGIGDVYMQFEELKARLQKEGLFSESHKKPLPKYPSRIGLITSPTGAALQDMKNVIRRRYPLVEYTVIPTTVQGQEAAADIVEAIRRADAMGFDVMILARGGGSLEDLYVFNDETVARTIYACETPIITGIGHEIDFTIADFVSDKRAPTPSAAAEIAIPSTEDVLMDLMNSEQKLNQKMQMMLTAFESKLKLASSRIESHSSVRISGTLSRLDVMKHRLESLVTVLLNDKGSKLKIDMEKLNASNPLELCRKGFSRVTKEDGSPLSRARDASKGDRLYITLPDGRIVSEVREIEEKDYGTDV